MKLLTCVRAAAMLALGKAQTMAVVSGLGRWPRHTLNLG